jgi:predicted HicB family RNase H-like nuclease
VSSEQQFNVYLPADLVRRVKHAAIDEGVSLKRFTMQALEHELERLEGETAVGREQMEDR